MNPVSNSDTNAPETAAEPGEMPASITAGEVAEAFPTVQKSVRHTPLFTSASVCEAAHLPEGTLFLKMENLQRTGSFKLRGATWRVATLTNAERGRGVVTASAGNHAQGVALAAREAGVSSTVFMPRFASLAKIEATENYGATVILEGGNFDEAVEAAKARAAQTGEVFISAYDDDAIITGQGSLGMEILHDMPDVETVLIPIGGGGLFSGVSIAVKAARPDCKIIGVQAEGADSAAQSFKGGKLLPRINACETIADGIAIKSPSPRTWAYIKKYADDVVTVSDEAIARAITLLLSRMKVVVEPSGAAGLAALMEHPGIAKGKTVVILCGGNIDVKLLSDLIERGMIRAQRYFHFFTSCSDKPGGLAGLLDLVAGVGASVMEVTHNRVSPHVAYGRTGVEMLVEVRGESHITELETALQQSGYPVRHLD